MVYFDMTVELDLAAVIVATYLAIQNHCVRNNKFLQPRMYSLDLSCKWIHCPAIAVGVSSRSAAGVLVVAFDDSIVVSFGSFVVYLSSDGINGICFRLERGTGALCYILPF